MFHLTRIKYLQSIINSNWLVIYFCNEVQKKKNHTVAEIIYSLIRIYFAYHLKLIPNVDLDQRTDGGHRVVMRRNAFMTAASSIRSS